MAIRYVTGDATRPVDSGPCVIVHVCNDIGQWGKGFVLAISRRWKLPEARFKAWYRGETGQPFQLGAVQLVEVERALWVANLVGQRGIVSKRDSAPPIRYEAVRAGLAKIRAHAVAETASVHMPRIGCGLAGGRWEEMTPLIDSELIAHGVAVTVHDLAS